MIFSRNTGKLCFATLRAGDGTEIQAMLSLANVGEEQLADWKDLVDIGDHVFVAGEVITSKRGELSVLADEWRMAAKALRPLPVAHKPLSEETRVRQRYVDLIVRPEAQQIARTRVAVVASIRQSLARRGYLEIETPMLQTLHGGATARPFVTHSNAFDIDLFLRIAPELFLKRAVVGGLERVFEMNRNFRNEGADRTHSPEFTMLEFYQAYADYQVMATITRELIQEAALAACGSLVVTHHDGTVHDLSGVWPQVDLYESLSAALGEDVSTQTGRERLRRAVRGGRHRGDPDGGARKAGRGAVRASRRADLHRADVRHGLPGRHVAPGAWPSDEAGRRREVGPVHQRRRVGHGLLRARRPGRPARAADGAGGAGGPR